MASTASSDLRRPVLAALLGLLLLAAAVLAYPSWISGLAAGLAVLPPILMRPSRQPTRPAAQPLDGGNAGPSPRAAVTAVELVDAMPEPMILIDRNGLVAHANAAAHAQFGPLGEGTSVALRFRAPEMLAFLRAVAIDPETPRSIDHAERTGIERWFRVASLPLARGSGLVALAFRDQSEARRIDRMRADFVANASHELRTPLASIGGFIETLRGPARNDEAARERFLAIMQDQAARMARLVDDLLSLSRLEMKGAVAPDRTVDLIGVLAHVANTLQPVADELGVAVERLGETGPLAVRGERDELIQVFENLLENALKYGGEGKRIVVETGAGEGGPASVSVRDFGAGIAREHIPRITERFYRVDAETSRARKGTGLGLAIVKHIVTRHGGRLLIDSQPGEGSTFTVELPRA